MSNWLNKISQYKEMPLPVQPTDGGSKGSRIIDDNMTSDTAKREKTKYPNATWLGSGVAGVAIECEPGIVCKYTTDEAEARLAKMISRRKDPGVVDIYSVELAQKSSVHNNKIWAIKAQKVVVLNSEESIVVNTLRNFIRQSMTYPTIEQVKMVLTSHDPDFVKLMYDKYFDLILKLYKSKMIMNDAHAENIGWDKGKNLVLFDLGLATPR